MPGGRCLALAATLAGLLCVTSTGSIVVTRAEVQAAVLVDVFVVASVAGSGGSGMLQAFDVPDTPCNECTCEPNTILLERVVEGNVLGLARGFGRSELVVLYVHEQVD